MRDEHLAMPLVSADCQFLAPAQQGDRCEVRSRIARFGGASFAVAHDIVRADGTMLAKGSEKRVWGRYANGPGTPLKGVQIPEEVKALFRAKT
jgi:acyl-CoA thioester hydrolase